MSEHALEIHRPQWHNDDLALICGIANAGGGYLIVGGAEGTRAKNVRRMYKVFESIPQLTQQTLGFACPAEPIMDGPHLCLEIAVPPATEPVSYEGQYYLYTSRGNELLQRAELDALLHRDSPDTTQGEESNTPVSSPTTAANQAESEHSSSSTQETSEDTQTAALSSNGAPTVKKSTSSKGQNIPAFKDRSIAASNDLYLTNTDEYVLKVLSANGRATAPKIASLLGISESTVRRSFRRLKEYGMIERVGSDKAGYWKVLL